jgi:excisionase family DNA binding protein
MTYGRWLSVNQIADYPGVGRDFVYRWSQKGVLPVHKVGQLSKFERDEVDAWCGPARDDDGHRGRMA